MTGPVVWRCTEEGPDYAVIEIDTDTFDKIQITVPRRQLDSGDLHELARQALEKWRAGRSAIHDAF